MEGAGVHKIGHFCEYHKCMTPISFHEMHIIYKKRFSRLYFQFQTSGQVRSAFDYLVIYLNYREILEQK